MNIADPCQEGTNLFLHQPTYHRFVMNQNVFPLITENASDF